MKKAMLSLVFCGMFCTGAQAAAPHISDFPLGITRDVVEFKATEPCKNYTPKQGEDTLCATVSFGGKDWQGVFLFEENLLEVITLSGKPDGSYIDAAVDGYQHSPYVLIRADASTLSWDLISLARAGNSEEDIQQRLTEVSSAIARNPQDSVTYIYVEPAIYEAFLEAPEREVVEEFPKSPVSGFTVSTMGVHVVIMDLEGMQKRGVHVAEPGLRTAPAHAANSGNLGNPVKTDTPDTTGNVDTPE